MTIKTMITPRRASLIISAALLIAVAIAASDGAIAPPPSIVRDLRNVPGQFRRASSTEPNGNKDFIAIEPGREAVIFNVRGAGVIQKIWATVLCADPAWPRTLVVEMVWDGETKPSVSAPLGDFFGIAMARRQEFQSEMLSILPHKGMGLNAAWPMPFSNGARIIIRNESTLPVQAFYYQIDYIETKPPRISAARFCASYRQNEPVNYIDTMKKFEIARINGGGCFVGYVLGIANTAGGWFGEGDEIMEIDGNVAQGTGLEDAVGSAWRPRDSYSGPTQGFLFDKNASDNWKGKHTLYRFFTEPPICFNSSFSISFEHRPQDAWTAVAYRYRNGGGDSADKLPAPDLRLPPMSIEAKNALSESRRLFAKIYRIAGWPNNFKSFEVVGDLIARTDELFEKGDYEAALRLLRAAARETGK